jgi:hypothetical protein
MQTFDGSIRESIRLTMISMLLGMDLLRSQAKLRTEIVAVSKITV